MDKIEKKNKKIFIPIAEPVLKGNELKYISNCIKTGWISSQGKYVIEFEKIFSRFCGSSYGVSTSNGTMALHLALKTLGIGLDDEVIVPTLTFVATANAVVYTGAKPIFVDSETSTWNMDPKKIEEKITNKTKAIIVVHLYGHPCDMDPILDIAKRYKLYVIEDSAQAHGARYKGRRVGSIGDIGCFSFYGNKIITTGEGGMIVTDNSEWYKRSCFLRDHSMSKERRYYHPEIGYNYRLTNVQAAIGLAQMERLNSMLSKREKINNLYDHLLCNVKGISLQPHAEWADQVCWLYSILVEKDFGFSRDKLIERLNKKGIDTRPFFIPMHMLPPYKTSQDFPVAEGLSEKGLNLPSSIALKDREIKFICDTIKKIKRKN